MIDYLRNFLILSEEEIRDGRCWEPEWVLKNFAPLAKEVFERCPANLKAGGCHLMLIGLSPQQDAPLGYYSLTAVLRSPTFEPEIEERCGRALSIGSGTQQAEAMNALNKAIANVDLMK